MKLDKVYHLENSDYCLQHYSYINNVLADTSFGLLRVFHTELGSLQRILRHVSKFNLGPRVRHETHEEGRRMRRLKRYEYYNKDEDNISNALNEFRHEAIVRRKVFV